MSDEKLRELERRWRESGTVEDEAVYLRERVRVGDLSQERLVLAAFVGNAVAALIVGGRPEDPEGSESESVPRTAGLLAFGGEEGICRVGIALYSTARSLLDGKALGSRWLRGIERADECFGRAETWVLNPTDSRARSAVCRCQKGLDRVFAGSYRTGGAHEQLAFRLASSALALAMFLSTKSPVAKSEKAYEIVSAGAYALVQQHEFPRPLELLLTRSVSDVCKRELIPWALGYGDPVRDRVEARKASGD